MNKAAIFPRVAFTDSFVVEVLDVVNERGPSVQSKKIVRWAWARVLDLERLEVNEGNGWKRDGSSG